MNLPVIQRFYEINSFSWDSLSSNGKKQFSSLIRTNEANSTKFCMFYFNRFDLLHKLGHIFIECLCSDCQHSSLENDYFANLFAVKYFQSKKEDDYLSMLEKWISILLKIYNIPFHLHKNITEESIPKYKSNIVTYAAMHFSSLQQCLSETRSLEEIIKDFSGKRMNPLNKGIVFRKGICGSDLLYECIFSVFEANHAFPEVKIHYPEEITLANIDWIGKCS